MNLQEIVRDAVGGFVAGFALGAYSPFRKAFEELEIAEILFNGSQRLTRTYEELTGKELDLKIELTKKDFADINAKADSVKRDIKYIWPLAAASIYSLASSLAIHSNLSENLIVSVPFSYIGSFIGRKFQAFRDRGRRKQIDTLKKSLADYDNIDRYLLDDKQREVIEKSFSELEQAILDGKEINPGDPNGPNSRIYNTIVRGNELYSPLLAGWSLMKTKGIMECALIQRKVRDFFEIGISQEQLDHGSIPTLILDYPIEPRVKVFIKESDRLLIQTIEWPGTRIIRNDKSYIGVIQGTTPKVNVISSELWIRDYSGLAKRIANEKGYTVMLMQTSPNVPEVIKQVSIAAAFLPEFEIYWRERRDEK